jgi:hypothetical protein
MTYKKTADERRSNLVLLRCIRQLCTIMMAVTIVQYTPSDCVTLAFQLRKIKKSGNEIYKTKIENSVVTELPSAKILWSNSTSVRFLSSCSRAR